MAKLKNLFKRKSSRDKSENVGKSHKNKIQMSPARTVASESSSTFTPLGQSALLRSLGSSAVFHDRNVHAEDCVQFIPGGAMARPYQDEYYAKRLSMGIQEYVPAPEDTIETIKTYIPPPEEAIETVFFDKDNHDLLSIPWEM